ncbi:MAG: 30S ribosomal protein S3 [Rickettsiales bacterium]|jgi:small subunit ribosomal protein S3|nr:30S ribosomal protein S3 [Rickettsiales bacterium]
MGQKVNAIGLRIGVNQQTESVWYANKEYAAQLHEDLKIRAYIRKALEQASIARVEIERLVKKLVITIHTAKPGVVIGRKGADIEKIKAHLTKLSSCEIHLNIVEVRRPESNAILIAESIAQQLEKRVSFRRAMKKSMQSALRFGALGIRVNCAGRLGGAEIARTEWYREGRVPLHTLRANIEYGVARANTTYGVIGVKVWVYKGDSVKKESVDSKRI